MSWQVALYAAAIVIPLIAFAIELIFIRRLGSRNAYIATGAIGLSFVLSLIGFLDYLVEADGLFADHVVASAENHEAAANVRAEVHPAPLVWQASFDWISLDQQLDGNPSRRALTFPLGIYIDSLSALMFLMVTFVATLIHVYSIAYMRDDPRYPRFFAYLSLFCFSMLGLVASPNLFMIFIFWELVGVCSYLLIGFWYEEKANADAANKAFIVNRVGDVGLLMGLGLLWMSFGTFDFRVISWAIRGPHGGFSEAYISMPLLTLAGIGIFAGCAGKSAQFPLHVWLPDAMAGPTPVSALIHAATMVAAGVYLVGRFFPVFTPAVLLLIAYTGTITLFIAATIALVQTDYKKVLAYSTVSQLGFMMLGLGVGGRAAGLFHLMTHAFFKALLFLGAGSVHHGVHTYEMPALGGLLRKMPITAYTMLVGTLAISGVPFFSGFYSKDAIFASAIARVWESPEHFLLVVIPAVGAILTAFYMFRMWFLIFGGTARGRTAAAHAGHTTWDDRKGDVQRHLNPVEHAHESEPLMTRPLIILAVCSIFAGWTIWLGIPYGTPVLEKILAYGEPIGVIDAHWAHYHALSTSLILAAFGIGLGAIFYAPEDLRYFVKYRGNPATAAQWFRPFYLLFQHKWYLDDLYHALFVRPCLAFARLCGLFDKMLVDGLVNSLATATRWLSRLESLFDRLGVDGLVTVISQMVYVAGDRGRLLQTGRIRNYLMFLTVALVGLFAGMFIWVSA